MGFDGDDPKLQSIADRLSFIELLERLARLRRLLKRNSVRTNEPAFGISQVLNNAVDQSIAHLSDFCDLLSMGERLSKGERIALVRTTTRIYSIFQEIHSLLTYLPTHSKRQETQVFLSSTLESLNCERSDVSIIAHDRYSFEQNDIASEVRHILASQSGIQLNANDQHPTVFLPFIEEDNPLYWANLVHECGHIESLGLSSFLKTITPIPKDENGILESWAKELFCDLFAIQVLGPAYLASFLAYSLVAFDSQGKEHGSRTHPPDIVRISLMRDLLERSSFPLKTTGIFEEFGCLNGLFYFVYESRSSVLRRQIGASHNERNDTVSAETLNEFVEHVARCIENSISLAPGTSKSDNAVGHLANRLSKGILLGSISDESAISKSLEMITGGDDSTVPADSLLSIKKALQEVPARPWEIINAGWLHKGNFVYPDLFELVFSNDNNSLSEKVDEMDRRLERTDALLLKSIEASQIHALIRVKLCY